ncbi:MAG: tyrosine--tRNA ligase [Pseudomonadales bacterium]|nr:tyrosine--tRNA ligase [Pseudomonadales bacterium]
MVINKDLLDEFRTLGLIAQVSNEDLLVKHLSSAVRTVYCGFDPTASSLHIGNLVPLLALRRFQLAGHKPILLVGGATGMIGDPGGRSSERELKSEELVRAFVAKIRTQASRFLEFDCGENSAIVVDNAEWTEALSVVDFLRDIGKHFSVNDMVRKETIKRRLQDDASGISYTEFSYMILQSYDYVVLNKKYDCSIQMGGSDQWGNITAGMDLVRRMNGNQAFALTYPLITNSDGTKFGKSMGNAVWIDAEKTSPYSFYQFWRNCADDDVVNYLKIFTFLSKDGLRQAALAHEQDPGKRTAHTLLAREVTRLVHGEEGVNAAERISEALFANKLAGLAIEDLNQLALDGMSSTRVAGHSTDLIEILVQSGLAVTPRGEVTAGQARKLIKSNAISVNGEKVSDMTLVLDSELALYGQYVVLQKGKKHHHLVILAED